MSVEAGGPEEDESERRALRLLASSISFPDPEPPRRPAPSLPFDVYGPLDPATRRAIEAAALEANERYLRAFVEEHSFCPYSRAGRAKGSTARFVHGLDGDGVDALLARMEGVARDPSKVVVQVILPLAEVGPQEWTRFCHALTAAGNDRLRAGADVYAVAPLHPRLEYCTVNPYALIPLFRRAPDPTIQWVRLDALAELYRGREGDTVYVDPAELTPDWTARQRTPLFDRIAETNQQMASRLGIGEIERVLADLSGAARARYARILFGDLDGAAPKCPHAVAPGSKRVSRPASLTAHRRGEKWALARVRELVPATPLAVVAGGVELVVVRAHDAIHVLEGRCPHRHASLADAVIEGERLVCRHHGWDFRLDSGRSEGVAGASVARFGGCERGGWLEVDADELAAHARARAPAFGDEDEIL